MTKNKFSLVILGLLALLLTAKLTLAVSLTLTKIGVLSTVGVDYSTVNYTGGIPTLEGTASPSAQVLIKIKTSTDATMSASPSGAWSFTPGVLDPGSSTVLITSGTESLTFQLIFNATTSATPTPVPDELPETGIWENYVPLLVAGFLVLFAGKYIKDKMMAWEGRRGL